MAVRIHLHEQSSGLVDRVDLSRQVVLRHAALRYMAVLNSKLYCQTSCLHMPAAVLRGADGLPGGHRYGADNLLAAAAHVDPADQRVMIACSLSNPITAASAQAAALQAVSNTASAKATCTLRPLMMRACVQIHCLPSYFCVFYGLVVTILVRPVAVVRFTHGSACRLPQHSHVLLCAAFSRFLSQR
jgi:hypothetical protein